jgi:hypothetical protein
VGARATNNAFLNRAVMKKGINRVRNRAESCYIEYITPVATFGLDHQIPDDPVFLSLLSKASFERRV